MRGEIVRESRKGGERESERRRERRESEIDSKREGREREEGRESVCVCVEGRERKMKRERYNTTAQRSPSLDMAPACSSRTARERCKYTPCTQTHCGSHPTHT